MIRLLCTDFDGTIFNECSAGSPISSRFLQTVATLTAQGAKWVISTGRDVHEVLSTLKYYHITPLPDYLSVVERKLYERIGDRYVSMEPWNQVCIEVHARLYAKIKPMLPELERWVSETYSSSFLYKDDYSPFCIIATNNPQADEILRHVAEYFAEIPELSIVRNDVYARTAHCDYHKGATLRELERHLGIGPEEVCVAGDHYNDLSMLKHEIAHYLVTPANAIPLVKERVAHEGGFVSQLTAGDGVADGILHAMGGAR